LRALIRDPELFPKNIVLKEHSRVAGNFLFLNPGGGLSLSEAFLGEIVGFVLQNGLVGCFQ